MENVMKAVRTQLMIAAMAGSLLAAAPGTASAQTGPDSEKFLNAIEKQKSDEVIDLVTRRGRAIINVRGYSGATPLTTAMGKRATQYVVYLLENGADPNLADKNGDTPLLIAARLGYGEGVTAMLGAKAAVDAANRQGETALIVAVQTRNAPIVKRLLEAGANPALTDNAAGLSARDYAVRDRRSSEILKLIDGVKKKPVFEAGPILR
jgi:ankyrin repeat protein